MSYRIVVAPSGFKESLTAPETAEAIAEGLTRVLPDAEIDPLPLVDGGEGTALALAKATGGTLQSVRATGPVGDPVDTHIGWLGDGTATAVVEMAAVAGLALVPRDRRDPGATTSYGVGELIRTALDGGARRILIGCGDSGTSDGGAGALQALGVRLLDAYGDELPPGGRGLDRLDRIDVSGLDPRLAGVDLPVACNPYNVLCGPSGVARVFGPQKGATPEQVEELAGALDRWAELLTRDVRHDVDFRTAAGSGASGGLGAGLAAVGATLRPRFDVLLEHVDLDTRLAMADLVVTAEGALDRQTTRGKIPAEVSRRAKRYGKPVLVLAGTIGEGAQEIRGVGVDAYSGILPAPIGLDEALARGREFLADAAERALLMVLLGTRLERPRDTSARLAGMTTGPWSLPTFLGRSTEESR